MRAGAPSTAAALAATTAIIALAVSPAAQAGTAAGSRAGSGSPGSTPTAAQRKVVGGPLMAGHGVIVRYPSSGKYQKLPKVPASAYVIADANTGQVLAAKDPHGEYGPASTLKVLTAVALIPRLNPNAMVTATKKEADVEPNDVGILPKHKYQVASLFKALLLISANDAAVALTDATGSFAKGMSMINAEAHRLQAYDVVARQPNGLPANGQVVSAYDEALIARQALSMPAFMRYDSMRSARFQVKKRKWVWLANQNQLLTQYRGGIGGKIGWTEKSKATYIGMARRNGVTLIVTVLRCTPLMEINAGEKLLNWGFAMRGRVKPVGTLVRPLPATAAATHHKKPPAATTHKHAHAARPISQAEAAPSSHTALDLAAGGGFILVFAASATFAIVRRRRRRTA
jgi:serine-type D-Ala-D-Ala carboxypeptidase (penicillin-binding protein 5/6)